MTKVYLFGVLSAGREGHHLYDGDTIVPRTFETPWGRHTDAFLCPDYATHPYPRSSVPPVLSSQEEQGKAWLHHRDGWSALSFWDRTGDARYRSNTTFLVHAPNVSYDELRALAEVTYPHVFARLRKAGIEVTCLNADAPRA